MSQSRKTGKSKRKGIILNHDNLRQAEDFLRLADPVLGRVIDLAGPCLLCETQNDNPFEQLCNAIIGQQLSVKAAHTIRGRVEELIGCFEPEPVLAADEEKLRACGLSRPKIRYVRALAAMVKAGELRIDDLSGLPSDDVLAELLKVPGIGRWTAEMFLIFNLKHSNVLALADAGLQRAVKKLYGPKATLEKAGKKWVPYCSVASWYLWQSLDANLFEVTS